MQQEALSKYNKTCSAAERSVFVEVKGANLIDQMSDDEFGLMSVKPPKGNR